MQQNHNIYQFLGICGLFNWISNAYGNIYTQISKYINLVVSPKYTTLTLDSIKTFEKTNENFFSKVSFWFLILNTKWKLLHIKKLSLIRIILWGFYEINMVWQRVVQHRQTKNTLLVIILFLFIFIFYIHYYNRINIWFLIRIYS